MTWRLMRTNWICTNNNIICSWNSELHLSSQIALFGFRFPSIKRVLLQTVAPAWSPSSIQQAGVLSPSVKVNPEVEVLDDCWDEKNHWNLYRTSPTWNPKTSPQSICINSFRTEVHVSGGASVLNHNVLSAMSTMLQSLLTFCTKLGPWERD